MKRELRAFMIGVLVSSLLISSVGFAGAIREKIEVVFNSINITVDGDPVKSDNMLYKGTTYVALRDVAEMLGKDVGWDGKTNTASIGQAKATSNAKPSDKYSRDNPAPVGVTQRYVQEYNGRNSHSIDVTVKEVLKGEEAIRKLAEEEMFNPHTMEGKDLVLAKIHKKLVDSHLDERKHINRSSFDTFTEANVEIPREFFRSVIDMKEKFKDTSLYKGAEYEGYIVYYIPKEEKNPKLAYLQDREGGLWFELFE